MNEIITYDQNTKLAVKPDAYKITSRVFYQLIDPSHYSFSYTMDDVSVRMDESDRKSKTTEFVDAEFSEKVDDSEKICYIAAAVSGIMTGILRNSGLADDFEEKILKFKNKKNWEKYVVSIAGLFGYMKSDYDGSLRFLRKRAVELVGEDRIKASSEQLLKCLSRLDAHPTLIGLIFSVTTQFTRKQYSIDDENKLITYDLPDYYAVGRNYHEKVVYGFLYWIFDLSVNVAYSQRNILDDLNIPKELIRIIKDLLYSSIMKNVPQNYEEASKAYSEWLIRLFQESEIVENGEEKVFDFEESINLSMKGIYRDSIPIVLNECIFRGFYFVHKLSTEIKNKDIRSIGDLNKINAGDILPYNSRTISRMCVIASGTYFGINVARNIIEMIKGKKAGDKKLSEILLDNIDIPGLGRFVIAVGMDIPYWKDDYEVILERIMKGKSVEKADEGYGEPILDSESADESYDSVYDKFTLDPLQARIMYSLEAIAVSRDIDKTKDERDRKSKKEWLELWKSRINKGLSDEDSFFISDEDKLYEGILIAAKDKENQRWLYLIGTELALFEPYHALGVESDKRFKRLKPDYDYVRDQFIRRQTVVSQEEVDTYIKKYKKYYGYTSGNNLKLATGAGIAAVVTLASGGVALAFAPQIAVALAGEAVVGLHGAALTSTSLAIIGGGSLAAGGLGMAGGTAIIAGGGALLGLASSSTVSVANMLMQTDEMFMPRQAAKMLSFSDVVLKDVLHDNETIGQLCKKTESMIKKSQNELNELQDEDNDLDKERIGKLKDYIKCLSRFLDGLQKLIK